jgi:hypothetical protein
MSRVTSRVVGEHRGARDVVEGVGTAVSPGLTPCPHGIPVTQEPCCAFRREATPVPTLNSRFRSQVSPSLRRAEAGPSPQLSEVDASAGVRRRISQVPAKASVPKTPATTKAARSPEPSGLPAVVS